MTIRIALASDLHIELSYGAVPIPVLPTDADVIVLAGDITNRYHKTKNQFDQTFAAFRRHFKQPILFIPGNHEYYGSHFQTLNQELPEICERYDITLLQMGYADIKGVRFFGCTLWSDFLLHGKDEMPWAIQAAQRRLADYRAISFNDELIQSVDTRALFKQHFKWLNNALNECPPTMKKVICTHFGPDKECVNPDYKGDELNPYYVNNLNDFITEQQPDLWLFGHTHFNVDYLVGKTRIVSNQLGYQREQTYFNSELCLELGE
ncbi:metallophosphoesterase [Alkalimarinus alittae]|uniref:Metallophosphoesterase n=1 Tax=Alkalimarinus alittae TaxID=2961619 RepID=A0ABY6N436_9ALTE|nr:metallophosphoesterase [Alkalimarinus alittae]UZE96757.1 metallophosphoesterase [Alkalimarinus alittae]